MKIRKYLSASGLYQIVRQRFSEIKDQRAANVVISLKDALMSGFAMFSLKDSSLLAFDQRRETDSNLGRVYGIVNDVPLRGGEDALEVNWCEITITRKDNGRQLYQNSFATSHKITKSNVVSIVQDGRARWKSENENNNVLKTKGYHLEHNFGHGQQFLASFLLTLNLLAFLFHTVFELLDERYQRIRKALGPRKTFFNDIRALLRYMIFEIGPIYSAL